MDVDHDLLKAQVQLQSADHVLDGRYQLLEQIGEGGMGRIYKALQVSTGRFVAVKFLTSTKPTPEGDDHHIRRFRQECAAIAEMSHPNIVSVIDYGVDDESRPYIVMEFVGGESLAEIIDANRQIAMGVFANIVRQLCDGLSHAHSKNLIHRDLKPSNVMIVSDGSGQTIVKIVDFGLAKRPDDKNITRTGEVLGSPVYMSPEQCMGQPLDCRSDIYSLGCLMFEALTGSLPFRGESTMEIVVQRVTTDPLTLKQAAPEREFPAQLQTIITKLLAQQPEHRYANADEVRSDVDAVLQGKTISTSAPSARQVNKASAAWIVSSCAIAAIVGAITYGAYNKPPERSVSRSSAAQSLATKSPAPQPITGAQLTQLENSVPALEISANYEAERDVVKKIVDGSIAIRGRNSVATARWYRKLGDIYRNLNKFSDAASCYEENANMASRKLLRTRKIRASRGTLRKQYQTDDSCGGSKCAAHRLLPKSRGRQLPLSWSGEQSRAAVACSLDHRP